MRHKMAQASLCVTLERGIKAANDSIIRDAEV